MIRNLTLQLLGLLLLIIPTAQPAAPDVFATNIEATRRDAFQHVTGMTEAAFRANAANVARVAANVPRVLHRNATDEYWVTNINTGREWYAGKFERASIQQLRDAIANRPRPIVRGAKRRRRAENAGTFSVIAGFNPTNLSIEQQKRCNVTALQADPANIGAVVQVASNFDCFEGAGPLLTDWTHARAQGELAAISALPGTIVRRYCLGPIDLLHNLPNAAFRLTGGVNKHLDLRRIAPAALAAASGFDEDLVEVGIQLDTDVTFGFVRAGARGAVVSHTTCLHDRNDAGRNPNIIQIYTSAVNLQLNAARNFAPATYAHVETIAQKMIKASYEGTLLAAALYGEQPEEDGKKQEVFLTLMGCGVFNNKLEWVADALEELVDDIQALNLNVTLLVFDGSSAGMDDFLPRMQALVEQTGGEYEEIRAGEDDKAEEAPDEEEGGRCVVM